MLRLAALLAIALLAASDAAAAEIVLETSVVADGPAPRLQVKADAALIGTVELPLGGPDPARAGGPADVALSTVRIEVPDDADPRRLQFLVPPARSGGPGPGTRVLIARVSFLGAGLPTIAARLSPQGADLGGGGIRLAPGGSAAFVRPLGGWPRPLAQPVAVAGPEPGADEAPPVDEPPSTPPVLRCRAASEAVLGYGTRDTGVPAVSEAAVRRAAAAATAGPCRVVVTGYASVSGTAAVNMELSRQRAEAVTAALVAAGVDPDRIETRAEGATDRFGPQRENRRVMIEVAPD